ncbi:hypothetical protein M513_11025 [Trichuris suis]|uniref:Transposase n=1 Tax=Trichuris suis TaxID=68888 RepID=A0A085LSY6_9BILA|nr:hypothetical protein M513_11025 [Trichuris suis]
MKQTKEWLSPGKDPTPRAKPKLHERKTMLSVWWDCEGVIHFELLPKNQTITTTIYVEQLRHLEQFSRNGKRSNMPSHFEV